MKNYDKSPELDTLLADEVVHTHVWRAKTLPWGQVYILQGVFLGFRNTPILGHDGCIKGWEPTHAIFRRDDGSYARFNVNEDLQDFFDDQGVEIGGYIGLGRFDDHWGLSRGLHPLELHCYTCGRGYEKMTRPIQSFQETHRMR